MTRIEKQEMMFSLAQGWAKSGLSQAEYALQNEINLVTLRYWIKKNRSKSKTAQSFIKLTDVVSQEIYLRYPNGVELSLPPNTSLSTLQSLIHF